MSSDPGAAASNALPAYAFPEEAALALGRAARYARWRRTPDDPPPDLPGVRREDAARLLAGRAGETPEWLDPDDVAEVCRCWGIPLVMSRTARNTRGVMTAARRVGYPVVLKAIAPGLTHKTDSGGVRVGLADEEQVVAAAKAMRRSVRRAGFHVEGFLVQPMVDTPVEMLVGVTSDPRLGPLIVCGAGGVRAEVERDVAVRLAPIGRREAGAALRSLRTHPLLEGFRGAPACDVAALEDLVVRTGLLAEAHPEVIELDFNPVAVSAGGAVVLDARIRVQRPAPAQPWPAVGTSPPVASA